MQLLSNLNKEIRLLLCVIGIYRKYAQVISLKDKKGIKTANTFKNVLDESNHKQNKIWGDKGTKFYNRPMKSWLQDNDVEMYLAHNEENLLLLKYLLEP